MLTPDKEKAGPRGPGKLNREASRLGDVGPASARDAPRGPCVRIQDPDGDFGGRSRKPGRMLRRNIDRPKLGSGPLVVHAQTDIFVMRHSHGCVCRSRTYRNYAFTSQTPPLPKGSSDVQQKLKISTAPPAATGNPGRRLPAGCRAAPPDIRSRHRSAALPGLAGSEPGRCSPAP